MSGNLRPMPDDFAQMAKSLSRHALRKRYKAGVFTLARWIDELGIDVDGRKMGYPMPCDFRDSYAVLSLREMEDHYGVSNDVVRRWTRELGAEKDILLAAKRGALGRRPLPDDWAEMAPRMTRTQAVDHYKAGSRTIARWERESGIVFRTFTPANLNRVKVVKRSAWLDPATRPRDMYTIAAELIARECRCPVYRCTERGAADAKGAFWRKGNVVLTDDELLERAARYERRAA